MDRAPVHHTANRSCIELFSVLRKIINQISDLDETDPAKLAKYTRCLFQVILPANEELARRLLDEACEMTKDARGVSLSSVSPSNPSETALFEPQF